MYHTPPKMVLTRKATKDTVPANMDLCVTEPHPQNSVKSEPVKLTVSLHEPTPQPSTSVVGASAQHVLPQHLPLSGPTKQRGTASRDGSLRRGNSHISASSSAKARRARLQLEAAEQKARIQMELIDKRLEADLADIDDEYSPLEVDRQSERTHTEVEKWLDKSQQQMETVQPTPANGPTTGELNPLHGTVEMLASALKQITTSTANKPDS
ncbi:hypothetical protein ACJJTC_018698, partial [Scirpophaga incertulas]